MRNYTKSLSEVENLLNNTEELPKKRTKVVKKDKSLIERTEDSTIILTEDNKQLLND